DDDDKAFIKELLKEHNAELEKKFVTADAATKIVEQGVTRGLDGLKVDEKINAAVEKVRPAAGAGDATDKSKNKGGEGSSIANDPEFLRMKEEFEKVQRQAREAEEARQAAERRQREQAMEAAAKDALARAGIPAERHAHALAYLRTRRTEDGK